MHPIDRKIQLQEAITLKQTHFINENIVVMHDAEFSCVCCKKTVPFHIKPYQTGFPLNNLYEKNHFINEEILLQNKIVQKTKAAQAYIGALSINNLPTLYFTSNCPNCKEGKYIGFFSYGEKQPGLEVLDIAGIWRYTFI